MTRIEALQGQLDDRDALIKELRGEWHKWKTIADARKSKAHDISVSKDEQTARLKGEVEWLTGLRIVCDGPPGQESGRFVEVETATGESVRAGEWRKRDDGRWELVIALPQIKSDDEVMICFDLSQKKDQHGPGWCGAKWPDDTPMDPAENGLAFADDWAGYYVADELETAIMNADGTIITVRRILEDNLAADPSFDRDGVLMEILNRLPC